MILAACGEGGSGAVGLLLTLGVFAICIAVAVLIVRGLGRDRRERRFLAGLLVATFVLGSFIVAAFYAGAFGDDSEGGKLAALLLVPGVLGAAIAHRTKAANSVKAFLISTLAPVSLVALWGGLFLVAFLIGGGGDICLE